MDLLTTREAAKIYGVSIDWLCRRKFVLDCVVRFSQTVMIDKKRLHKHKDYLKAASTFIKQKGGIKGETLLQIQHSLNKGVLHEIALKDRYSASQIAKLFGVGDSLIYNLAAAKLITKIKQGLYSGDSVAKFGRLMEQFIPKELEFRRLIGTLKETPKETTHKEEKPKKQVDLQKPVKPRNIMISAVIEEPYFHKLKKLDLKKMTMEEKEECFTGLLHKGFISVPLVVKN